MLPDLSTREGLDEFVEMALALGFGPQRSDRRRTTGERRSYPNDVDPRAPRRRPSPPRNYHPPGPPGAGWTGRAAPTDPRQTQSRYREATDRFRESPRDIPRTYPYAYREDDTELDNRPLRRHYRR